MSIPDYNFFDDNEFEDQFRKRVDQVRTEFGHLPFLPVGNPYVDTGVTTVAIFHKIDIIEVTLGHALDAFLNINHLNSMGKEFVRRNKRVKSVTMMYSLANPLTNPAYGKSKYKIPEYVYPSKAEPSPLQERVFRTFSIEFLYAYGIDQISEEGIHQCMTCGDFVSMDFNELETTIDALIKQDKSEKKELGSGIHRGWFPLIGTLGSSAQALPGQAEFHIICGKCLFLVNFIPQVADLAKGKLALYQSNSYQLVRRLVERNFSEFNNMDSSVPHNKKLEVIGANDQTYHIIGILNTITNLERELAKNNLIIWMFNNIGLGPDMEYLELPGETLVTLYDMTHLPSGMATIERLIAAEEKLNIYGERQFLDCIRRNIDYPGFYRKTDIEIDHIIPQIFYDYYQIAVRYYTVENIQTLQKIALKTREEKSSDQIERILKERNYTNLRYLLQPIILAMIDEDELTGDQVIALFASKNTKVPRRNPWRPFWFYLHPNLPLSIYQDHYENIEPPHYTNVLPQEIEKLENLAERTRERMDHGNIKFLDVIDRYSVYNIRQEFIRASRSVLGLTWKYWEILDHEINWRDIEFFFRIYCRTAQGLDVDLAPRNINLIMESGLHPEVTQGIIDYIDIRIKETSARRAFSEIPDDLQRRRYTQFNLYKTITDKLTNNEREGISEFAWFAYEKDNSPNAKYSWPRMRDKIRVLFFQYRLLYQQKQTLEEQIKE